MPLGRRQLGVLNEVVWRYLRRGVPVSSTQVASAPAVSLSAATVRNVMAQLEEEGFLERSHRSAGRVPTDRGLRVFIDTHRGTSRLRRQRATDLVSRITVHRRDLVEDVEWVARLISDVTHEAGVVVRPIDRERCLEAVSFVPLGDGRVLGVVVTTDGAVEKRVFRAPATMTGEELTRSANVLSREFHGQRVSQIEAALRRVSSGAHPGTRPGPLPGAEASLPLMRELLSGLPEKVEMAVAGAGNLAASRDFSKGRELGTALAVLEDRKRILEALRRFLVGDRTRVIIGRESEITAQGNLGMVAMAFSQGGRRIGAVGVLGPRRMDYMKILPVVELIGSTLTEMLDQMGADENAGTKHA
ncbi:MAG: heat-inducible transcription repressor HrcA [Acidobacteria bacterium]|nr:heat-inducible transcription repressor HrcA [Acidobacteriota bacterium]